MEIPDWAKGVRISQYGIVLECEAGPGWPGDHYRRYRAGPFSVEKDSPDAFWEIDEEMCGPIKTVGCYGFLKARWMVTRRFFERLVDHVDDSVVKAILKAWTAKYDWVAPLIAADRLGDLGLTNEEELVRHFVPKTKRAPRKKRSTV